ncbi:MAG: isocitrate lyase/phosphoenolpyruvate mutase family protein, partial [Pseudomonadota bacterium]
ARILEACGFEALATTSAGFAMSLGRRDYRVTREEALAHARAIVDAVDIPVTADLENGFGAAPEDAAETIRLAAETGLVGGSIEDSTGDKDAPLFDEDAAVDRVAAAVDAARAAPDGFMVTARAEAFLYGETDLDAVIRRLQRYSAAGADVLYAPGLPDLAAVRAVCGAVDKPVNVLIYGALAEHALPDFAAAGATRLSIGSGLSLKAYADLAEAATQIQRTGGFNALHTDKDARRIAFKAMR